MSLITSVRASCVDARQWAGNLRIETKLLLGRPGRCASFLPRRAGVNRAAIAVAATALFDKWIEERETQATESWRILRARTCPGGRRDSGDLCVSAITTVHPGSGNRAGCALCEGARYAEIPWSDLQANQNRNFQLESLILAQNERWRQA